ncbi:MAG: mercury transporter MerT [Deltaproteobacteria bacterium]|nr:mercury transporter MerT [Deltaproteobacteria bacterium]
MTTTNTEHDGCILPEAVAGQPATLRELGADPAAPKTEGWSVAANAGAVVSAFVASACCVGPLVFALLGLGGAALLVKLEPYRPYFMTLTFALLGAGFYFTYRKPRAAAVGAACGCAAPRTNRAGRIMLWAATGLVVALLAFPYIAPLIWA